MPGRPPESWVLDAVAILSFGLGLLLAWAAVRGVDDTRSRQLFVSAPQMQLKRAQRLHREMPAVSDERWKRWRNQTIGAIERDYPSELERFVMGSEGSR